MEYCDRGRPLNIPKGSELVLNFIKAFSTMPGIEIKQADISKQVFRVSGRLDCFLYIKGRGATPYRWGITKNVLKRLDDQDLPWFVVLLFDSPKNGYLLSPADVEYYIKTEWPMAADGDYKVRTGTCLSENKPLKETNEFILELAKLTS